MQKKLIHSLILSIIICITMVNSFLDTNHKQFLEWISKYQKQYHHDQFVYRYNIFIKNIQQIQIHNARARNNLQSYFMGVNQFTDLTSQEFTQIYTNTVITSSNYVCTGPQPPTADLPDTWDWAARSAVTSVKNIKTQCTGGGYAIAAAEVIQAGRFIGTKQLIEMSAQQIIDCSKNFGNDGCTGGGMENTFDYIHRNGITSAAKYPFTASFGTCNYSITEKQWQILGCTKITSGNQTLLRGGVHQKPVATYIDSTPLQSYSSGIFQSSLLNRCNPNKLNHWMVIVGFGNDAKSKKNYWKLKNSWGIGWGVQGYLFIYRNGDGVGQCGMQQNLYYPID